jgi:hypothetical protein
MMFKSRSILAPKHNANGGSWNKSFNKDIHYYDARIKEVDMFEAESRHSKGIKNALA